MSTRKGIRRENQGASRRDFIKTAAVAAGAAGELSACDSAATFEHHHQRWCQEDHNDQKDKPTGDEACPAPSFIPFPPSHTFRRRRTRKR
jgi:hypothetical protein